MSDRAGRRGSKRRKLSVSDDDDVFQAESMDEAEDVGEGRSSSVPGNRLFCLPVQTTS